MSLHLPVLFGNQGTNFGKKNFSVIVINTFLLKGNDKFIFYTFITICRFCNSFLKNHLIMRNERQLRKILWINSMGGRIWCFSSCRSVASSLRKKVFHSIFFRLGATGLQVVFQV